MNFASRAVRSLRPWLRQHPSIKRVARTAEEQLFRWKHDLARSFPALIQPKPRQITIAITAACNLKCRGCRYGRDFMVGERLPLETVLQTLDDARAAGVATARFYGGEPLLHKDLPAMIRHARSIGLDAYITTNATLLGDRIDELVAAGLQWLTIGFYGVGEKYDEYTQRDGHFDKLCRSLTAVRERHGDRVEMQLNYMLSARSCSMEDLRAAWQLVEKFGLFMGVDPVSKTIPFFKDPSDGLALTAEHEQRLADVVAELERLKEAFPGRIPPSRTFLRSLPDLLLRDSASEIPCDAYELLWVGADGTVQLCDVTFPLGNLHEKRLSELLFTETHCKAARDGFQLKCPTCMCKIDSRIRRHSESVRRHGR